MADPSLSDPAIGARPDPIARGDTHEQFMAILRRKLAERGYSGEQLERKLEEITAKEDISFRIDWDEVMRPLRETL